jgi:lysophospholipase L1-like esterase
LVDLVSVRYVAIGDSFTEGVGDEREDGPPRGWADLVAAGLAVAAGEPISYANLAVRGRLLADITGPQLDAALALDPAPTLVTLNGGGNDMLRPRTDVAALARQSERVVDRCAAAGVRLVLISGADPSGGLPLGRVVHRRAEELTAHVARLAAERDLDFVDVFHDVELHRPVYWSPDRLHLGADGHRRAAGLILAGVLGDGAPPVPAVDPAPAPVRGRREQVDYYREHVLPWVGRHVRGRSSGDGVSPKHPDWVSVSPRGAERGAVELG